MINNIIVWHISYFYLGLVDAKDEDALRCKLALCEESWNTKERDNLPQGQVPTFHRYILERVRYETSRHLSRTYRHAVKPGVHDVLNKTWRPSFPSPVQVLQHT